MVFHLAQNQLALTGGGVALSKSLWLGLAVLFWYVLPVIILIDRRVALALKRPFQLLLLLMVVRGVIEGLMLYVFRNWSPFYGIAHDLLCGALLLGWCARNRHLRNPVDRVTDAPLLWRHAWATGVLFIPEIYYAWFMQAHFTTQGASPVYFVPDDDAYLQVLTVTTAVNIAICAYLVLFLHDWLHGHTQRSRS